MATDSVNDSTKQRENRTNIIVKGLLWSGSGTIVGLLREYDSTVQVPGGVDEVAPTGYIKLGEFNDFRMPKGVGDFIHDPNDGLKDIERLILRRKRVIQRYPLRIIRNSLSQKIMLREAIATLRSVSTVNRALINLVDRFRTSTDIADRIACGQAWIHDLNAIATSSQRFLVFDQPINFSHHDDIWSKIFEPFKMIVVIRHPLDQIAEIIRHNRLRAHMTAEVSLLYGWDRKSALQFRIDVILKRYESLEQLQARYGDSLAIFVFEDVVNCYHQSKQALEDFLEIDRTEHIYPHKYLDPSWSVHNINIHDNVFSSEELTVIDPLIERYNAFRSVSLPRTGGYL